MLYRVWVEQSDYIEVEAESQEQAEEKALDLAHTNTNNLVVASIREIK